MLRLRVDPADPADPEDPEDPGLLLLAGPGK